MKTFEGPRIHFPAHHTRATDGTRLRYFDSEEPLPPIVLANGLGGPAAAWKPFVERWRGRYRVISWDYRGLYGSILPHRTADLSVPAHATDLRAVLDDAGVEKAAFLGWSMGVQVGLEFYTQNSSRLSALALINGTYGRPLHGVPLPLSGITLPPLVQGARKLRRIGNKLLHGISRTPLSYTVLKRLRVIAPGFKRDHFEKMIDEFKTVDLDIYFDLIAHLQKHDAHDQLPNIDAPTLVMAGSRDIITPLWFARRMVESLPNAELFVIPGGTHYSAAEYPDLVAARVEGFLSGEPEPEKAQTA